MRYDVTDFTVKPGDEVRVVLDNEDDMPHNLLIFQPGTDVLELAASLMDKPEETFKNGYVPDDPRLVARSTLIQPKSKDEFIFKVPEKVGVYPFVCTFPGHAAIMNGRMHVSLVTPGLTDLKFALYQGKWEKLPDFSGLTPHREGDIPDGLVQIELDDYKNHFGIVYTGKLNVPKDGDYTFSIAGDDGLRLLIDGKAAVENEGSQAAKTKAAMTRLAAGVRDVRVEYFQTEGELGIYLAWKGAEFSNTALSKRLHADTKSSDTTGMSLLVGSEPEIYRNFIAKADARPIGVGYPGGFNLAWDAAQMNLVLLWRGGFIDTALHWKHRGGGEQPPMGRIKCARVEIPRCRSWCSILPKPHGPCPTRKR